MEDEQAEERRERLWICVARLALLERLGLGDGGELGKSLRQMIAELDPRPPQEILAALREADGFRAFEDSERERYAQVAGISPTGKELLLRSLTVNVSMERLRAPDYPEAPSSGRARALRVSRDRRDPSCKRRRRAAKAARRKNRKH